MMVKTDSVYLIDHELAFEIDETTYDKFISWQWDSKFYEYHVFYKLLSNSAVSSKKDYFCSFEEYLRLLNINKLRPYLEQLATYNYSTIKHSLALDYLSKMKQKSNNFVSLLKGIINIK